MYNNAKVFRALPPALALCVVPLWLCTSVCRADNFGDVWVSADAIYTGNTFHGYAEARLTLENHSTAKTHAVTLNFPGDSYGGFGNSIGRLSRSVTLAPQSHEVVTLLQPPLPINGGGTIGVEVDGRSVGDVRAPNANNHCAGYYRYSRSGAPTTTVLISRGLDFDSVCGIFNAGIGSPAAGMSVGFGGTGTASVSLGYSAEGLRAEVPASQFSGDWLAYTPFDFVVLSHRDFAGLSPEAAAALWSYAQAGGNLLVFGSDGLPQAWDAPQTPLNDGSEYSPALGTLFVMKSEDASSVDPDSIQKLRSALNGEAGYWQSLPSDITAANSMLPLVDDLKLAIRGLVFLMLVFIIIIGPVNLFVLNRRKRRTWMLWTIPAISLATTLLVFVYILLREGITPTVRIAGLTVLDQASHHAATVGGEGYYCPLTPSGGLQFDLDTEATPPLSAEDRSGNAREVDWSGSQNFTSGWVSARVPAFFHLRKSQTRRERLQVESKDGGLQMVNGLGAPIKSVWFADAHMNLYEAHDVGAGQAGVLTALSSSPAADSLRGPERLWRDITFTGQSDGLDQNAVNYLTPNTYIAVLDGNPFLENGLGPGVNRKKTKISAVVFGILDAADSL